MRATTLERRPLAARARALTLREVVVVGLAALCGAGIVASLAVGVERGWEEGLLCLLGTGALAAAALPHFLRSRLDLIEPISFVILMVAVGVSAKTFYVCLGPADRVAFLLLGKQPGDLLFAALVTAAGLLCLSCGYLLAGVRWRLPSVARLARSSWSTRRLFALAGVLAIVGLFSFLLFSLRFDPSFEELSDISSKRLARVEGSRIPGGLGYLRWGAKLIEVAFYLVLAYWASARKRLLSAAGVAVVALALASAVYPVFASSRGTIMMMLVRAVVVWICLRGEPRPRSVAAVVALGFLVISPMLALRRGASDLSALGEELSPAGIVDATVGGRHFLDLSKTAHVMEAMSDRLEYQYGKTLVTWVVAPVPRELWPQKPPVNIGKFLGPELFGSSSGSGVPPGIVAELYMNFGLAGVLVGLLGFGALLRLVYASLRPFLASPAVVLIYALLSTRLAIDVVSLSASGGITRLLKELVPMLAALYLLSRRPAGSTPGGPATGGAG